MRKQFVIAALSTALGAAFSFQPFSARAQVLDRGTIVTRSLAVGIDASRNVKPCGDPTIVGGCMMVVMTMPKQVTFKPFDILAIPPGTAVNIAAQISTGCYFVNTSSSPLYVSMHDTASAASTPVAIGVLFRCPAPSAQPISVFNASGNPATITGEAW